MLGCLDVAGLDLSLPASDQPVAFSVDVVPSEAEIAGPEVVQRSSHAFTLSAPGLAACDVDLVRRCITVRAIDTDATAQLAHFVADVVLPRIASLDGRCLHAACVVVEGRALALIGASGAGKSTLAARLCLEGALLLGDDCTHVRDGLVHPTHRPSRVWPDAAALLGLPTSRPDATGKLSLSEDQGVVRCATPVPLHEVLVIDSVSRSVGISEALDLLVTESMRLVIPTPVVALDTALDFLCSFGPSRTIPRDAGFDELRTTL